MRSLKHTKLKIKDLRNATFAHWITVEAFRLKPFYILVDRKSLTIALSCNHQAVGKWKHNVFIKLMYHLSEAYMPSKSLNRSQVKVIGGRQSVDKWMCTFLIRYLKQILLNIFSKYIESVALLDIINLSQKAFSNKGLDLVRYGVYSSTSFLGHVVVFFFK